MHRNSIHTVIAVALFGACALTGCKKNADDSAMLPPPIVLEPTPTPIRMPAPAPAPAPAKLSVTTVELGNAVSTTYRVRAPLSTFATNDTIHASVATDGGSPGHLTAKWTFQDGQVIQTQEKMIVPGPQITDFSLSNPNGWPVGDYRIELRVDGLVAQTVYFEVRNTR